MRLALIPARGGSKGIIDKNLQVVGDMSLVERAIIEAKNSGIFDKIFLSTDEPRIAAVGLKFGAEILSRKQALATDAALISDVILDHIETLSLKIEDQLWLIQPTALFRQNADFQSVVKAISGSENRKIYGFTVRRVDDTHPARMYRFNDNEWKAVIPDQQHFRRQDLEHMFLRDGLFYYSSIEALLEHNGNFFGENPLCVDLKKKYYANIDNQQDLAYARFLVSEKLI